MRIILENALKLVIISYIIQILNIIVKFRHVLQPDLQ